MNASFLEIKNISPILRGGEIPNGFVSYDFQAAIWFSLGWAKGKTSQIDETSKNFREKIGIYPNHIYDSDKFSIKNFEKTIEVISEALNLCQADTLKKISEYYNHNFLEGESFAFPWVVIAETLAKGAIAWAGGKIAQEIFSKYSNGEANYEFLCYSEKRNRSPEARLYKS